MTLWKRVLILILLVGLSLPGNCSQIFAAPPVVAVHLDGVPLQFDVSPAFRQDSLMIPLRRVYEEMGYFVYWEAETKRIVIRRPGRTIVLYPDNPLYSVNGVVHRSSNPPFIERGRTMVDMAFLRESAGVKNLVWDDAKGILHIEFGAARDDGLPRPELPYEMDEESYAVNFVEVILPPGKRIQVGEVFEIIIAAPFIKNIYSYEIRFFYNPEIIMIKDIKNPTYKPQQEFYMKRINNREGIVEYTQTTLGYADEIPTRKNLAVIEAIAFREGAVPFLEGNLNIKLLDNHASPITVALEENTLYTGSLR